MIRIFINEHPTPEAVAAHVAAHPRTDSNAKVVAKLRPKNMTALWLLRTGGSRPTIVALRVGEDGSVECDMGLYCNEIADTTQFTWRPLTADGLPVDYEVALRLIGEMCR